MRKNNKKDNILIKRNLVCEMKKFGISRSNEKSIKALDDYVLDELRKILRLLKEELIVHGKKTLEKEDVERVLRMVNRKEEFEI